MRKKVKENTVTLVTVDGKKQVFGVAHAERLLDMGDALNGGWRVAEDSEYYYDEEYGLRLKADKANSAKA